jgi:hypothetical protein
MKVRPILPADVEDILGHVDPNEIEEVQKTNDDFEDNDEISILNSLKLNSPFTKHFMDIKEDCVYICSEMVYDDNNEANIFYEPKIINLLMDRFMPYCFIWSAFILQDMDETTRLTNGCIESYFGSRKNNAPKRISRKPAQYTTYVYPLIKGLCIRFNEKENVKK